MSSPDERRGGQEGLVEEGWGKVEKGDVEEVEEGRWKVSKWLCCCSQKLVGVGI